MGARYYPIFLDLTDKEALVVGAGQVGRRKIAALMETSLARVVVVDPAAPLSEAELFSQHSCTQVAKAPGARDEASLPQLMVHRRPFAEDDVQGKILVFAATAGRDVNESVRRACDALGILCNVADAGEDCGFLVPSVIRQGDLTLALATGGASPALTRHMRRVLEAWMGNRYTALAALLARLRPLVLARVEGTEAHSDLFRALVASSLAEHLAARDFAAARELLERLLPKALRGFTGELLHDL